MSPSRPDSGQLDLFTGDHVPLVRYRNALERLDFPDAAACAPEAWQDLLGDICHVLGTRAPSPALARRLAALHCRPGWPPELERAWLRMMGRCLDAAEPPAEQDGRIAAQFLLAGRDRDLALVSARRTLTVRPAEARAWAVLAEFQPFPAAVRRFFHGGPGGDDLDDVLEMVDEDELEPVHRWALPYAFIAGHVVRTDLAEALAADGLLSQIPLPMPGNADAFTWFVVAEDDAYRNRLLTPVSPVEARRALQRISPRTFRRFMALFPLFSQGRRV